MLSMDEMMREGKALQYERKKWIDQRIEMYGDPRIIEFIADVLFHGSPGVRTEDSIETVRCLFEAGYCFYFAKMLERAFPGGKVCVCHPFGHVVYVYEGVAYDINGVSDAEYQMYVPEEEYEDCMLDFMHIPGRSGGTTDGKLARIGEMIKREDKDVPAISQMTPISDKVLRQSEAVASKNPGAEFRDDYRVFCMEHSRLCNDLERGYIDDHEANEFLTEFCFRSGMCYPVIRYFERKLTKEASHDTTSMKAF